MAVADMGEGERQDETEHHEHDAAEHDSCSDLEDQLQVPIAPHAYIVVSRWLDPFELNQPVGADQLQRM